MRSRYAAYVAGDTAYLLRTWHPATRPERIDLDPALRWTGLEVLRTEGGGPEDGKGVVEFRASYLTDAGPGRPPRGQPLLPVRRRVGLRARQAPLHLRNVDTSPHAGRAAGSRTAHGVGSPAP